MNRKTALGIPAEGCSTQRISYILYNNNNKIKRILFRQHSTKHNSANCNRNNKHSSSNICTNRRTQWNRRKYKTIFNKENIRQQLGFMGNR